MPGPHSARINAKRLGSLSAKPPSWKGGGADGKRPSTSQFHLHGPCPKIGCPPHLSMIWARPVEKKSGPPAEVLDLRMWRSVRRTMPRTFRGFDADGCECPCEPCRKLVRGVAPNHVIPRSIPDIAPG
jgi:hypothetical protein